MRDRAYWLAALVAWPAAVWCGIELLLRGATGYADGLIGPSATLACAAGTIVAVHIRRSAIAAATARR